MNELEEHLNRLVSFLNDWGAPSSWLRVMFVEDSSITYGAPSLIPRAALASQGEYAARFAEHLNAGHAWINMSVAGILDGVLLVIIELPRYKNYVPRDKVSVNFSGPAVLSGKPQWDASTRYRIVD
jgi:hypothetical protein